MESKWQRKAKPMETGNFFGFDTLHARKDFGIPKLDSEYSGSGAAKSGPTSCGIYRVLVFFEPKKS